MAESPLESAIETNAAGPKKAAGDDGSMEQHSLPDLIAADEHLANKTASRRSKLPIRVGKFIPGGTV
jgi:hypothetical protein